MRGNNRSRCDRKGGMGIAHARHCDRHRLQRERERTADVQVSGSRYEEGQAHVYRALGDAETSFPFERLNNA